MREQSTSLALLRGRQYHQAEYSGEAACITRQSTPTPKGVRSLRSHLFLGAGYFHVMQHVPRLRLYERAGTEAALTLLPQQSIYLSKGSRRPQNVAVSNAASSKQIVPAAQVPEGTRCRNTVALRPLQRLNAGTGQHRWLRVAGASIIRPNIQGRPLA
jgi:hypothetical protein